jgi:hypothetical protein
VAKRAGRINAKKSFFKRWVMSSLETGRGRGADSTVAHASDSPFFPYLCYQCHPWFSFSSEKLLN